MPGTFTIDFQDRTRASITYEAVAPRSGDAWTEMLYHVAFCVGRALVNLELEERVEYARKFDAWVGNGFADFPVHVAPPASLTPCARFVSSFDGDVPSYTRGAYGFGLNARGLDYYGPMAAAVLLHHVHDAWDRAEDLLQPVRALCRRVVDEGADEAGHVTFVTDCVTEALKNFERRGIHPAAVQRSSADLDPMPLRAAAPGQPWRNALAVAGVALMLVFWLALYFRPSPPATVLAPPGPVVAKTPAPQEREEVQRPPERVPAPLPLPPSKPSPVTEEPKRVEVVTPSKAPVAEEAPRPVPPPVTAPAPKVEIPVKPKEVAVPETPAKVAPPAPVQLPVQPKPEPKPEQKPVQEARVAPPSPTPMHERMVTGRDGVPMVLVPAGEFVMGNQAEEDAPPHRVYLDAFYIDRHEVTNGRYLKFVEATRHRAPPFPIPPPSVGACRPTGSTRPHRTNPR